MNPITIDPARLASGEWCHKSDKTIGQGDIYGSYSADRIGMNQPIRKPFTWRGGLWVCVGMAGRKGELSAEAYSLAHPRVFAGSPVSYAERTRDGGEIARADPNGFYHGMTVKHGGNMFVLSGPPVTFIPGQRQAEQMTLF